MGSRKRARAVVRANVARDVVDADVERDARDLVDVFGRGGGAGDGRDARGADAETSRETDGGDVDGGTWTRARTRGDATPWIADAVMFAEVLEGFFDGDVERVLRECRDERNVAWSEGEIEEAMRALREDGKTINAPFCFAPGAIRLKQSLHEREWRAFRAGRFDATTDSYARAGVAGQWYWRPDSDARADVEREEMDANVGSGECEVGVYVSVSGGDVAEWHRDVGHNGTIQLTGSKVWEVEEYVDGGAVPRGFIRNASLTDEPQCGADYCVQPRAWPRSASAFGNSSVVRKHRIDPGQTICLNKGVFHRVTPVGRDVCVSVDVRVTKPETAEWMAESVYLRHLSEHSSAMRDAVALMPIAPIRWMPFETEFSDGLVIGARLKFIVSSARNESGGYDDISTYRNRLSWKSYDEYRKSGQKSALKIDVEPRGLAFNPTCACSVTTTGEYYVLNVKATSALTGKDLMSEFNIYIDRDEVKTEVDAQMFESPLTFTEFDRDPRDPTRTRKFIRRSDVQEMRKQGVGLPLPEGTLIISDAIASLRCVLLDANILMFDDERASLSSFWRKVAGGDENLNRFDATRVPASEVRDSGRLRWDGQHARRFFAS